MPPVSTKLTQSPCLLKIPKVCQRPSLHCSFEFGGQFTNRDSINTNVHDARHSYASLMIAAGVNAKALRTYMGHGNIAIAFDLYGHLMPGSHDEAASLLDAYLARADCGAPRANPGLERTVAKDRRLGSLCT